MHRVAAGSSGSNSNSNSNRGLMMIFRQSLLLLLLASIAAMMVCQPCQCKAFRRPPAFVHSSLSRTARVLINNNNNNHQHHRPFENHHHDHRFGPPPPSLQPLIRLSPLPTTSPSSPSSSSWSALQMALVPLSVDDLDGLLHVRGPPTGEQSASYWGRTQNERYGRIFESSVVTLLGCVFSYFLSFVLGGFVATIMGCTFLFWSIFSPTLQAYQRNWELRGGRDIIDPWIAQEEQIRAQREQQFAEEEEDDDDDGDSSFFNFDTDKLGLYGALFLGRIDDVCVVEEVIATASEEYDLAEFQDYKMEEDEMERLNGVPYLVRVKACDFDDRTLQVHARMSEEYLGLEVGQPVLGVMLSTSPHFTKLAALTDLFVPDLDVWIGDYPYLDKAMTQQLLASDDEIWDLLQDQRLEEDDIDDDDDDEDDKRTSNDDSSNSNDGKITPKIR